MAKLSFTISMLSSIALVCSACLQRTPDTATATELDDAIQVAGVSASPDGFGDYWYQGKAELTTYDLEQARYGELRRGNAVLVYVTEDFSITKGVKVNDASVAGADAVKVMKLNFAKKFNTGIYPYSTMSSVFTPIPESGLPTLRVTTTVQEWCGHTYSQLRRTARGYRADIFSYFENEDLSQADIDDALAEDGIWNQIRVNPAALPVGTVRLIPGLTYQRFSHEELRAYDAQASVEDSKDRPGLTEYRLDYPELGRQLVILFESSFPFAIEEWKETYAEGFGGNLVPLTTHATRRRRIVTDYWTKNGNEDAAWRDSLGLSRDEG